MILSTIALLLAAIFVFASFGSRLSPSRSFTWWLIFGFLIFASIYPGGLEPVASFFGFVLVSNFVFSALIMFFLVELISLSQRDTDVWKRIRKLVSKQAAANFKTTPIESKDSVLIVLPCFNEEENLAAMQTALEQLVEGKPNWNFCFVDDGSSDGSSDFLQHNASNHYVEHDVNIGVAGVMATGFYIADRNGYRWVVQCDADGQHPVDKISELVRTAERLNADLVIGSRFVDGSQFDASTSATRILGSRIIRFGLSLFGRSASVTDPTSGFRIYSRKAREVLLRNLPEEYLEPESIAHLVVHGCLIKEIACSMKPRQGGVSSIRGFKPAVYMMKVLTALLGLRLRNHFKIPKRTSPTP